MNYIYMVHTDTQYCSINSNCVDYYNKNINYILLNMNYTTLLLVSSNTTIIYVYNIYYRYYI